MIIVVADLHDNNVGLATATFKKSMHDLDDTPLVWTRSMKRISTLSKSREVLTGDVIAGSACRPL